MNEPKPADPRWTAANTNTQRRWPAPTTPPPVNPPKGGGQS